MNVNIDRLAKWKHALHGGICLLDTITSCCFFTNILMPEKVVMSSSPQAKKPKADTSENQGTTLINKPCATLQISLLLACMVQDF